ncbi:MAG: metal-binding protein [Xenococcaceae cyanobacterium MO_207.B15]|nr:metal-binding protein [Xenococcaceae cyanobacterium MO_207.B15]
MPSGSTHDRITLWLLPGVVALSYLVTRDGELTLLLGGGFFFAGLMFGPDLDIYSIQFKRWGILRVIWLPYQKLLRHRSFLSHGLIIGTVIRILYLLLWLFLVGVWGVAIAQSFWGFEWNWQSFILAVIKSITQVYLPEAIALFMGLDLGAMSHSISDWIDSSSKKKRKSKLSKSKARK